MDFYNNYLEDIKKQFLYYKVLGDKTISQMPEEKLFLQPNDQSNSIAIIVQHLNGNMLSRFTDFLTSDGEKEWRNRDEEFMFSKSSKTNLLTLWQEGWACLFNTINKLQPADLTQTIYIRNMGQTVIEAVNRQLAHYAYHIGQIVYIGKMKCESNWVSLTIPIGKSKEFNTNKFIKPKQYQHFSEDLLKPKNE